MSAIKHVWMTLNRQCNLRCRWCYASSTGYHQADNMPVKLAEEIIDFLSELHPEYVSLIGGEPTCYPDLEHVIHRMRAYGMKTTLFTNGLVFCHQAYLDQLISAGLHGVNLSMKGWSTESYLQSTGVDGYGAMQKAIQNISNSPLESIVSFVISPENVDSYLVAVTDACAWGASYIYLSFEQNFSALDGKQSPRELSKIFYMIESFMKSYEQLQAITGGNFVLHQSFPLCVWDAKFIEKLRSNRQILTSCQLLERSGLVFDTNGSLLPCNSMYQVPIGKFGVDFTSKQEFEQFWNCDKIRKIYEEFAKLPSCICESCQESTQCGGGCIANWFDYPHEQWLSAYQEYQQHQDLNKLIDNMEIRSQSN